MAGAKAFNKKADQGRRKQIRAEEKAVRDAVKLSREFRRRVLEILEDWKSKGVEGIARGKAELVDQVMAEFERFRELMLGQLDRKARAAWDEALDQATEPFKALGVNIRVSLIESEFLLVLTPELFDAVSEFTASVFDKLTPDKRAKTTQIVNQAIFGGESAGEIVDLLAKEFGTKTAYDMERLVRTTIAGVQDLAAEQFRQEFLRKNKRFEGVMQKQWLHSSQTVGSGARAGHVALDGKIIDVDKEFRNPITGRKLRFAHDPLAHPSETINCQCRTVDYIDPDADLTELVSDEEIEALF